MQVTDGSPYLHENPYLYESLTTATMGFAEYISPCKNQLICRRIRQEMTPAAQSPSNALWREPYTSKAPLMP